MPNNPEGATPTAADTALEGITQELANWLRDLRKHVDKGPIALIIFLALRSPEVPRMLEQLKNTGAKGVEWATAKLGWLSDEGDLGYRKIFQQAMIGLGAVLGLGILCLCLGAFLTTVGWRAITILPCDVIISVATIWLWGRVLPPLVKLGVVLGILGQEAEAEFSLWSLLNLPKIFGGVSRGAQQGLTWAEDLWHRIGKVPYWFAVGSFYLILVPLWKAPAMVAVAATTIPVYFYGNLAWRKHERNPIWTFMNWFSAFVLLDCWLYAQYAEFFVPRIFNQDSYVLHGVFHAATHARSGVVNSLIVLALVEFITCIHLTFRRPLATADQAGRGSVPYYPQPRGWHRTVVMSLLLLAIILVVGYLCILNTHSGFLVGVNQALRNGGW